MSQVELPNYRARITPALHDIQEQYGYLNREALERYAAETNTPLQKLMAVASFFPHFRMTPPPALTLRVCRDTACHMAGSGEMLTQLCEASAADKNIKVEGVSCLGRCDRAPAACVSLHKVREEKPAGESHAAHAAHQDGHDLYYLGKNINELASIVRACLRGHPPRPDRDADLKYKAADWKIDAYEGKPCDYAAVLKLVALRRESLRKAAETLAAKPGWSTAKAEQFRAVAERGRGLPTPPPPKDVLDAVRAWQTGDGWAKDDAFSAWAKPFLDEIDKAKADLRGMGGAGVPATQKWTDVRNAVRTARKRQLDDRAFIVVNGDESEPATFKDRELLLKAPHTVLEGVILAGLMTEASQGFIYIRHEYPEQIKACEEEIRRAEALGVCGPRASALGRPFPVSVFVSPGGYVCGEQSALIEAMSDRRSEPRNMPPKLETNGLEDRPTLVSNVETFAWAPYIWLKGGQAYADMGVNGWRGRRFFSVCGDVKRPGVYEVPMGMPLKDLIYGDQYCGGIVGDKPLKSFAPSGPSGGFLPAKLTLTKRQAEGDDWKKLAARHNLDPASTTVDITALELELNLFRALSPTQALGAGLVVYAEGRDMVDQAVNAIEFFRNESCGKCVPCRLGSQKMVALGTNLLDKKIGTDVWFDKLLPLVNDLGETMIMASICALGKSVPVPLKTTIDFFPADLNHYIPGAGNRPAAAAPARPPRAPAANTTSAAATAATAPANADVPAAAPAPTAAPTQTTSQATPPEVRS